MSISEANVSPLYSFIDHFQCNCYIFFFVRRMPFDEKTSVGYFIAFSLQYISMYYCMHIAACSNSFMIASCWMIMTFAKEIKREWIATKQLAESDQLEFKKRVHEYIEFHSSVKQLRKSRNILIFQ